MTLFRLRRGGSLRKQLQCWGDVYFAARLTRRVSRLRFQCVEENTPMSDQHPNSEIPAHHSPFEHPLSYFSDQFNSAWPIKIVAIGSSSTAGEGGIPPYPCRLELALRNPYAWPEGADKFKNRMIDVRNRGKSGDEAPGERARLQEDVIEEHPSLVIWQVGTNAVWKGYDLAE